MTINNVKIIYDKLKMIGLTRPQIKKILPNWWSPDIEKHSDGIAEFCLLLSRRLNFDLASLLNGDVIFKDAAKAINYKHRADATLQSLQISTCIATSLAQAVISSVSQNYTPISSSPAVLANLALANGNGIVSFSSLIDVCWSLGIPVIPIPNLPVGIRKMDGAVIKVNDRPVIIVSKKPSSRAWLAFIVAHEIGHIGCGHLENNGSIVDVSLQEQTTYESEYTMDSQEREADSFALSLLGGESVEAIISGWPTWISPVDIAVRAMEASTILGVESGHLVLRFAFRTKRWPDAMTSLRFLSEDADAESIMKSALQRNLNFDLVAEDIKDYVCQITGIDC